MTHLHDVIFLRPEEEVRAIIRRHGFFLVRDLLLPAALLIAPFFFLFRAARFGFLGWMIVMASVGVGALLAWRVFLKWDTEAGVFTNQRFLQVALFGFTARVAAESSIRSAHVTHIAHPSLGVQWLGTGTITVALQSGTSVLLKNIPHPEMLKQLVQRLQDEANKSPADAHKDFRAAIEKKIASASADALEKIAAILHVPSS